MSKLLSRLARLERAAPRGGWRAYVGTPPEQWPDAALLGLLAEKEVWPAGFVPSDEDLGAIVERAADAAR